MVKRNNFLLSKGDQEDIENSIHSDQTHDVWYSSSFNFFFDSFFMTRIRSSPKRSISNNLQMRTILDEHGRGELALILDEFTTIEEVRNSWPDIQREGQMLLKKQGIDPNNFYYQTRQQYAQMKSNGFSYTEAAMAANYDTLCNLIQLNKLLNSDNLIETEQIYNVINVRLGALGLKENIINDWIGQGIADLRQNHVPWGLNSGPVDKQRIVDLTRQFSQQREAKRIIFETNLQILLWGKKAGLVSFFEFSVKDQVILDNAQQLLSQLPKSGGLNKLMDAYRKYQLRVKEASPDDETIQYFQRLPKSGHIDPLFFDKWGNKFEKG